MTKPRKSPTPIRNKRSSPQPSPPPEKDLDVVKQPSDDRTPGPKILQLIAAATVGYAVAAEGVGVLLATESLEYALATVAEVFTGRTVKQLEIVFEDEVP